MLKALVGIASEQGLAVLQPERTETLSFIQGKTRPGTDDVAFWAVLEDNDARCVHALLVGGLHREALHFLDRTARDIGRILPVDSVSPIH